jgi:hypothetical protein
MVGLLPPVHPSMSMRVQDDTSVTDGADTLMYQGRLAASMPHGAWWTDMSLASRPVNARWLASGLRRHDSELPSCCFAMQSSNSWISRWVLRSSGVAGSRSLRSKATAS